MNVYRRPLLIAALLTVLMFLPGRVGAAETCRGDCKNGRGAVVDARGRVQYEGQWRQGRFHGRGVYHYDNGDRYEGDFQNGTPDGQGTYFNADGSIRYRGDWNAGQPHGRGEFFIDPGKRYMGQVERGKFHGSGTYFFASGARYEGEFQAGFFQGRGAFFGPDGLKRSGRFERDLLVEEDGENAETGPAATATTEGDGGRPLLVGAARFDRYVPALRGRRVAVVTNHSALVEGEHLLTHLQRSGVNVRRVFAPEHGLDGRAGPGETIANGRSTRFGLPVVSLYGKNKAPTRNSIRDIDVLIYDIQDVGVRFYTYISTLHYVMDACARYRVPLVVLDRPNPNGFYVDGPTLRPRYRSFTGMHPVPLVHGMTTGEYARMINGEGWLGRGLRCALTVVPAANYTHSVRYAPPVRPSPNLPNIQSIYLYPHLGLFEATALSVGRGTPFPFQVFGHPSLPGNFRFVPIPARGAGSLKLLGELCRGFDLRGDPAAGRPGLNLRWLIEAYRSFPRRDRFFNRGQFAYMAGGPELLRQIEAGWSEERIRASWQADLDRFKRIRQKYLLYE